MALMVALLCSPWWQNTTGQVITQDGGFAQLYLKATVRGRGSVRDEGQRQ